MSGTISDWIIEMEKRGFSETAKEFHSDKLTDYQRLKNSGLPIFDDFRTPYSRFCKHNPELMDFLAKYPSFCIRALPNNPDLPRRFELGVKSFEDCKKFLDETLDPELGDRYDVLISEYGQEDPATRSGII
ncbi:hypothetical protein GOV06_03570, partial [Candidatus Woesearchaeota archaeon]|nr:hypothetical protein [Candidatus Woesearchaeota archaeon]